MAPIVEAGALDLTVVETEAEGTHEVQDGAGGQAGATDVAGVPGDLRCHQRDVQRPWRAAHEAATGSSSASQRESAMPGAGTSPEGPSTFSALAPSPSW